MTSNRHRLLKRVLAWGSQIIVHHCFQTFSQYKPKRVRAPGSGRCRHSSQWSSGLEGWPCTAASRSESDTQWQPGANSHLSTAETWRHHMQSMSSPYRVMGFNRVGELARQSWTLLLLRPKSSPGYLTPTTQLSVPVQALIDTFYPST